MAPHKVTRLAPVTARDGVDTRNKENSVCPCEGARGDSLPVDLITGVALDACWGDLMIGHDRSWYTDIARDYSDFRVWQDLTDEPAKYGDDIAEWLDLDAQLRSGNSRWRVAAYWALQTEREEAERRREDIALAEAQKVWRKIFSVAAKKAASECEKRWAMRDIKAFVAKVRHSVVAIQSLVRGHQVRVPVDCWMCLAHARSPFKTEVGYMCHACKADGPYTDVVPDDPWNWFRA